MSKQGVRTFLVQKNRQQDPEKGVDGGRHGIEYC